MTQLIINGVEYPETSNDKFKAHPEDKGEYIRMASGLLVFEVSMRYMVIEYSYDYFPDALLRQSLADLRGGRDLNVFYLTPDGDGFASGIFKCVKTPVPSYAFSIGDEVFWHNVAFRLEGVDGLA